MGRFQGCFHLREQAFNGNTYVQGLLSNLERKSIEPIALELNEDPRAVRNFQYFMQNWMMSRRWQSIIRDCRESLSPWRYDYD